MSVEWTLNDDLGDPISNIESLKYLIIDNYGRNGSRSNKSCKKTDTKGFIRVDEGERGIWLMEKHL